MTRIAELHEQAAPARRLPMSPRGALSARLMSMLEQPSGGRPEDASLDDLVDDAIQSAVSVTLDDDIQLSLLLLYSTHYGSFSTIDDDWEWRGDLVRARVALEHAFEAELRGTVTPPAAPAVRRTAVAATLAALTAHGDRPGLPWFVAKSATDEQLLEYLIQRSVYGLREADPHSIAISRLGGRSKAALVEIQSDEYGRGRPERMHSRLFARTMEGVGLSSAYGHYVDRVPAVTLASSNLMSMFGMNRRLRGAVAGHLAAFQAASSIPNLMYGNGFRRLGYGAGVTEYFDEHVSADAIHEQIAAQDLAGALAEDEPALIDDILFGASACLLVEGWMAAHMHEAWSSDESSLRVPVV